MLPCRVVEPQYLSCAYVWVPVYQDIIIILKTSNNNRKGGRTRKMVVEVAAVIAATSETWKLYKHVLDLVCASTERSLYDFMAKHVRFLRKEVHSYVWQKVLLQNFFTCLPPYLPSSRVHECMLFWKILWLYFGEDFVFLFIFMYRHILPFHGEKTVFLRRKKQTGKLFCFRFR